MPLAHITEPLGGALIRLDEAAASRSGKSIVQTIADAQGWEAPEQGTERCRMLEAALSYRGTPYQFRGGHGRHDAWSLIRTCAAHAAQRDCVDIPRTEPGYAGVSDAAARLAFGQWGLVEIKSRHAQPGDVLLFSVPDAPMFGGGGTIPGGVHASILSAPGGEISWAILPGHSRPEPKMVHAYPAKAVCEAWVGKVWTDKLVAAFSFDTGRKARPFRLAA
ncbi:hypothetical protein [Brevundimonas sp. LjRoot202]|uniref:hypothetical protein n=1 Tax=Brevundimonas sp. LjRoot202 TaxID=3342281 RepID=UPI003ED0C66F